MQVKRLTIERFRGVKHAELHFDGHTLLIGPNNAGKSTICEALDLVLGPDRLSSFPPVEEFDFYNASYLNEAGEPQSLRVEVVLTDLPDEIVNACPTHLEFWDRKQMKLLAEGEIAEVDGDDTVVCLRLETRGTYDPVEDEFLADTFYCHGTNNFDGTPEKVSRKTKRLFGFLYLRTVRTGSRALSLERGSLLDIILRLQGARAGLWENSIQRLRDLTPPIGSDASGLNQVLENIEQRLAQYIHLPATQATKLFVSQLTREHLRKTISFFLSTNADQQPVPFFEAGTGTLNTLVLALLSFIADVKPHNVIFAMEEPEIALPPHTQRRIANYLLNDTSQCFVTSHSPYVIERFSVDQIHILRRGATGAVTATAVGSGTLKAKLYRRHARRGLAEAMLGRGVIVVEGFTEHTALMAAAEVMEGADDNYYPLDLSGITIFAVDGDGGLPEFGAFYKSLHLKTYAFYDKKTRTPQEVAKFAASFDHPLETAYTGAEKLLAAETPVVNQWSLLENIRDNGELPNLPVPAAKPDDAAVRDLTYNALKSQKGNTLAGRLIELGTADEVPKTIKEFLQQIYADFPRPPKVPPPPPAATAGVSPSITLGTS